MPTRPRQHILEDLAHAALRKVFAKAGWVTEQLSEDYGEDFLVRVFCEEQATPFTIYIQSKSTDSIERYISKDSTTFSYPIATRHLVHWQQFWEPVVLTLYDTATSNTYWRVIQPWFENLPSIRRDRLYRTKTAKVTIPINNILDENGIERLGLYAENRFYRFLREQEGADNLVKSLQQIIGLEISYDAQNGILAIPHGYFTPSNGGVECYFFGKMGAKIAEIAESQGKTEDQVLRHFVEYIGSLKEQDLVNMERKTLPIDDA